MKCYCGEEMNVHDFATLRDHLFEANRRLNMIKENLCLTEQERRLDDV